MKTAKAVATVIQIECPYCDEGIIDPDTGAYAIYEDTNIKSTVTCSSCGKSSKLPRKAGVFV